MLVPYKAMCILYDCTRITCEGGGRKACGFWLRNKVALGEEDDVQIRF